VAAAMTWPAIAGRRRDSDQWPRRWSQSIVKPLVLVASAPKYSGTLA